MIKVVQEALDPIYCEWNFDENISNFNQFLIKDGYIAEIICGKHRNHVKVSPLASQLIYFPSQIITSEFIKEQVQKCNSKIRKNDLDGAITNARSLLEAVIEEILKSLGHEIAEKDRGNLLVLFKHCKKHLNFDSNKEMADCFKQIVSGVTSCINGVAAMSNKTSDRHCRRYKPRRHHAQLAIDSAFMTCKFLLAILENKKTKTC